MPVSQDLKFRFEAEIKREKQVFKPKETCKEHIRQRLEAYLSLLEGWTSRQEILDQTLDFLKRELRAPAGCIRSVYSDPTGEGSDLIFRSIKCLHAAEAERYRKLDQQAIITTATRRGLPIVEGRQATHPRNAFRLRTIGSGRIEDKQIDDGSILVSVFPVGESAPQFVLGCCHLGERDYFAPDDLALAQVILQHMTETYRARSELEEAGKLEGLGPDCNEVRLTKFLEPILLEKIPHHFAYFIPFRPDSEGAEEMRQQPYPILLPTDGLQKRLGPGFGSGIRPDQDTILAFAAENTKEIVIGWRSAAVLELKTDGGRKSEPQVQIQNLAYTVALFPCRTQGDLKGYLWIERWGVDRAKFYEGTLQRIAREAGGERSGVRFSFIGSG